MVRLLSVLVLLVREGLVCIWGLPCKLVEVLALTEEGTSEEPLAFLSGRSSCLLSALWGTS